jgi:hypothetical protein
MSIKGVSYSFLMCHIDSPTGCLTSSVIDFKATESLNEAKGAEGGVFPKKMPSIRSILAGGVISRVAARVAQAFGTCS